jgi:adenosylcobinamide kinase / adenosylcobinamide-phosphate guanylyltransferase
MGNDPNEITLVLGGCRSGKSLYALEFAEKNHAGENNLFLATCVPHDEEMKDRVHRHQDERGSQWQALEVPVDIAGAIREHGAGADVILVDCLTLWVSNLFMESEDYDRTLSYALDLQEALKDAACPVILVSNELGMGIVPENALARRYRDAVGGVNQAVAKCAHRVILTVAGIPMTVKGED